jgi:uncharacterized lipoprotein YmbA
MIKALVIVGAIVLSGCASQTTQQGYDISDYNTFKIDCSRAREQAEYLQSKITGFHEYFRNRSTTLDERKYYTRLKNNLWSLRSSCSVFQRGV